MEYINPTNLLTAEVKRYQVVTLALAVLLGISITCVPLILKSGNPTVLEQEGMASLIEAKPWKFSIARIEGFTKKYLSSRFEWNQDDFQSKSNALKSITSEAVFAKLKESISAFSVLTQNQKAKSYYVFEGFGFSNAQKKIEARITRILRIKHLAMATPLIIRISYQDVAVSEANPYGLVVDGVEEAELTESDLAQERKE